jgi:hypothetical protein
MAAVLRFFVTYALLIYLILALGLFLALRRLWMAQQETRQSVYGLERELSRRHMGQAIAALLIIGLLATAELILAVFLMPVLPAASVLSTPTINPLSTPTSQLGPEVLHTTRTPGSTATVTASGCIPGQIMITAPKPGDVLSGTVTLMGTADIPNLGYYKYEFSPRGTENWSTIKAAHTVVPNGQLGTWDTTALVSGDYLLRLVVTDNLGQELPGCVLPIRVVAP